MPGIRAAHRRLARRFLLLCASPGAKCTVSNVLLVGGGHAHVAVLADWARSGCPASRAALLTPEPTLRYSGMVPGWISGEHALDDGIVDLAALARAAGVDLVLDRCIAIDPAARSVLTMHSGLMEFDIASLDTGGVGNASAAFGHDPRLLDVRPISAFVERIGQVHARLTLDGRSDHLRLAVIGGGAGGVELAFALNNWRGLDQRTNVILIAGESGLLPGFSAAVRGRVERELERQSIALLPVDAWIEDGVLMAGEALVETDYMIAALGSGAPDWPRSGGMAVDEEGFVAVDRYQRSISHPHILAAGDIAARRDREVPHSGVHAVFAGPVLARNLRDIMAGKAPSDIYRPRWNHLYLMSTGAGEAIASYGPLGAQGRWVSRLKTWIDKRWIASYAAFGAQA